MVKIEKAFVESKIIAILRNIPQEKTKAVVNALRAAGIMLCEITLNSQAALKSIGICREEYQGKMFIGAGTVLNIHAAIEAHEAGAEFIVTPNTDKSVIEYCVNKDIPCFPGALTPTEIAAAMSYGTRYVKLFPASAFGPKYIKELSGPFDNAKLVAVGGINKDNAIEYIKAGCVGVGVGGGLCPAELVNAGFYDEITARAAELVKNLS